MKNRTNRKKMADLSTNRSIISLNVNGLQLPSK